MSANMSNFQVAASWAGTVAIGSAAFWYYSRSTPRGRQQAAAQQASKAGEPRKRSKSKKAKKDEAATSDDGNRKPSKAAKKKSQVVSSASKSEAPATTEDADEPDHHEDLSTKEFARNMMAARSDAVIGNSSKESVKKQKSVKQAKAKEIEAPGYTTTGSSAAGGDADDDRSPVYSPEIGATTVNDMLEPAQAGPSVLNITAPTNPAKAKAKKENKAPAPVETKKQRQNRNKAELAKVARQEEEKERKVLEEKHRRSAREAEGRLAKDGSAFMQSQAPKDSAWTAPAVSSNGSSATNGDLLDTFEVKPTSVKSTGQQSSAQSKLNGAYNGLSEDEMIKHAVQESTEWKTVEAKKKAKKANAENVKPAAAEKAGKEEPSALPKDEELSSPDQDWEVPATHAVGNGRKPREIVIEDSEWEVA